MPDSHLDPSEELLRPRPLQILALWPVGTVTGMFVGAFFNAINGLISPIYFQTVFPFWPRGGGMTWLSSVGQGVVEGLVFGFVSSLILLVAIGLISKLRCPFGMGFSVLFKVIAYSLLFGLIGAVNAVLIAQFWPQFFQLFDGLPSAKMDALRFAWVSGAIHGVYFGAVLSVIGAILSFAAKWRRLEKQAREGVLEAV